MTETYVEALQDHGPSEFQDRDNASRRDGSGRPGPAQPTASPEDLRDIRQCLRGDGNSFRRLIDRHQQHVAGIMWRFSMDPDTHGELVGEVFIEAFQGLGSYRGQAPFEHWLARIATRVGYRHWRTQRRERAIQTVSLEECYELADRPLEEVAPDEAAQVLNRLLAQLPPRDRLVLTLRYVEGCSVKETAERTGWSETMVKIQAFRARKKLERLYRQAEEGEQI